MIIFLKNGFNVDSPHHLTSSWTTAAAAARGVRRGSVLEARPGLHMGMWAAVPVGGGVCGEIRNGFGFDIKINPRVL